MNKNKIVVLVSGITVILLMVAGISFAVFRFGTDSSNQELVLGDIWMKYTESNGISLENALPGDEYTNYFEFTITGTNTYTKKDIYYDISLTHGDTPAGKTEENRIADKYLKFRLTEVLGNTETEIFTDKTYDDLNNKRVHVETISKSTNEYSKTYRLYMVISEELTYGNSSDAILTTEEFGKIFGSIKVNVTGDFNEKELNNDSQSTPLLTTFRGVLETRTNSYIEDTDGIIYISGNKDDNNPETTNDIDFNYVWYSGKLWRITSIYPDGRIKMITDDVMTTISYGDKSFYDDRNISWVYTWLNNVFLPTLHNYEYIIENESWNVSPSDETISNKLPEGEDGMLVSSFVGLLNTYEYYKSYEKIDDYANGFLNIGYYWWLLNSYNATSKTWFVDNSGLGVNGNDNRNSYGVRPSINLKSTIEFNDGTGTKDDPYTINENRKTIKENMTLINTRSSGEYVKLVDEENAPVFRIIGAESINDKLTTKLVLDDNVRDTNDIDSNGNTTEVLKLPFGTSVNWDTNSEMAYWRGYLNTTWIQEIDTTYNMVTGTSDILEKGAYYMGRVLFGASFTGAMSGTIVSDYSGLLRYGEMFSVSKSSALWLLTKYGNSSVVWMIYGNGCGRDDVDPSLSKAYAAIPTINLKSIIVIKSGSGTKQDPFVVGLPS